MQLFGRPTITTLVLISVLLLVGGCGMFGPGEEASTAEIEAVAVHTAPAARGDVARSISFSARIEPRSRADVVAEVAGEVEEVAVSEGDMVESGDLLLTIDSEYLRIQVRQAQSQLDSALAGLEDAQRAYESARREIDRLEPLYREGAVSRQAWDSATDDLEMARRAAERSAPAAVSGARASLDAARAQLGDAVVRAPLGGEVAVLSVSTGDQVGTGTHLVTVTDRSNVEVVGLLSERQVVQVSQGMTARIGVGAYPDLELEASVGNIGAVMDPGGAGYPVKLLLDNPTGQLRMGMAAEVFVEVERASDVITVPVGALVDREDDPSVFVVDGETVQKRSVQIGLSNGDVVEIRSGLDVDEPVVITGQSYLEDGSRVRVVGEGLNR